MENENVIKKFRKYESTFECVNCGKRTRSVTLDQQDLCPNCLAESYAHNDHFDNHKENGHVGDMPDLENCPACKWYVKFMKATNCGSNEEKVSRFIQKNPHPFNKGWK